MKRAFRLLAATACLVAIGSTASAPALAQSPAEKARAKEAYDRGVAAHDRGDFKKAAEEFARADAIAPSNVALQAAIDAAIEADDPALGSELVERSARTQPTGALAASIDTAKKKFAGRAGRLRVVCPSGSTCLATLDGVTAPIDKPVWTRAGQHTVIVQVDAEAQTRLVDVKAEQIAEVAPGKPGARGVTPAPTPTPAPAPSPSSSTTPHATSPAPTPTPAPAPAPAASGLPPVVFWVGLGATVLVGGGSTALAFVTKSQHDDFVSKGCEKASSTVCVDTKDAGETNQLLTNIGFGATAVLGVTTVVIGAAFTNWSGRATTGAAPVVAPVAGGAIAGWSGRF